MSKAPAPPPRRALPKIFRRQNSFAGFPTTSLSIFNNSTNNATSTTTTTTTSIATTNQSIENVVSSSQLVVSTTLARTTTDIFTTTTASIMTNQAKCQKMPSSSQFYSLPRHAKPLSNPSLMRTSTSGLALYLISRNATQSAKKVSAAEQLGVKLPPGGKFMSLPRLGSQRKHANEMAQSKTSGYLSLPRPSVKSSSGIAVLSLPPTNLNLSLFNDEINLKDNSKSEQDTNKCKKHDSNQQSYKSSSIEPKSQTTPRKANFDLKLQPLPKKSSKETECQHYHQSKKQNKDEASHQTLPRKPQTQNPVHFIENQIPDIYIPDIDLHSRESLVVDLFFFWFGWIFPMFFLQIERHVELTLTVWSGPWDYSHSHWCRHFYFLFCKNRREEMVKNTYILKWLLFSIKFP